MGLLRSKIVKYLIAAAIVVVAALVIARQQQEIYTLMVERDQLVRVADQRARVATMYINRYNQKVSENKELSLTIDNVQDLSKTVQLDFLKQFDNLKNDYRNVETALRVESSANADLRIKLNYPISEIIEDKSAPAVPDRERVLFEYADKFNSIKGIPQGDSIRLIARISVPLNGVIYWQRKRHFIFQKWRFGRKEYFSELTSANPWVNISDHEFIKVIKR